MTSAGTVRIIGGQLRNSRLQVPVIEGLRPTSERLRETLFNWLAPRISGMRVLDLFAGTGALGIEAMSRGAASACFVERDRTAADALQQNLQRLRLVPPAARLVRGDAAGFLAGQASAHDLVLLDPPFALDLWSTMATQLESAGWLADAAWIYVESPADQIPPLPGNWTVHREGRAGAVRYALYRRGGGLG
ncbi:16S rRNA (guanine(966)-N(2))-methyltransferase RsmD [Frateuria aurantia]